MSFFSFLLLAWSTTTAFSFCTVFETLFSINTVPCRAVIPAASKKNDVIIQTQGVHVLGVRVDQRSVKALDDKF